MRLVDPSETRVVLIPDLKLSPCFKYCICYPQKLALTSPTGGGRSVGIVRSRTKATELYVLLGISPASDCVMPTFRNPLSGPSLTLNVPN
jgi:hypothetical protein